MKQLNLPIDRPLPSPVAKDPNIHPDDRPRLSAQCVAVLERLRRGPATSLELAEIALKYTSRTSDLTAAGYNVVCERVAGNRRVFLYTLLPPGQRPERKTECLDAERRKAIRYIRRIGDSADSETAVDCLRRIQTAVEKALSLHSQEKEH